MELVLPQTTDEWLLLAAPILTFAIGICYFLAPASILHHIGIEAVDHHPEAIGEGRTSFAGFLIGLPIIAFLFQQPVLFLALALSWAAVIVGKLIHLVTGGWRRKTWSVLLRFFVSVVIAVLAWRAAFGGYAPVFEDNLWGVPEIPSTLTTTLPFIAAVIMMIFALICFFAPTTALAIMRLRPVAGAPAAAGEARGLLAGFYFGLSLLLLMKPDVTFGPAQYVGIAFAIGWALTGFGRMITMLSDRGNNLFNWFSLLFELGLAALPLVVIFGLVV